MYLIPIEEITSSFKWNLVFEMQFIFRNERIKSIIKEIKEIEN